MSGQAKVTDGGVFSLPLAIGAIDIGTCGDFPDLLETSSHSCAVAYIC